MSGEAGWVSAAVPPVDEPSGPEVVLRYCPEHALQFDPYDPNITALDP